MVHSGAIGSYDLTKATDDELDTLITRFWSGWKLALSKTRASNLYSSLLALGGEASEKVISQLTSIAGATSTACSGHIEQS
jgi:hypothetical protein